jgi:hypothetical protein
MTGLERYRAGYAMALRVTAVSTSLLIILSFRRSVWLFFLTGLIVIAFRAARRRRLTVTKTWRLLSAAAVVTAVVLVSFGGEVVAARVASINPAADNEFTATNADHVNDIKDALAVIGENPVFGFGTGTFYETDRIANWKESSFEVHNAVLHVWLKFGLLGLITYLGFHYRLIRTLLRYDDHVIAGFGAAGVFFLAEQVEMLMQTWAYGSIHLSIHHGILIGVLLVAAGPRGRAFVGEEGVAVPERGAAGHAAGSSFAAGGDFAQ